MAEPGSEDVGATRTHLDQRMMEVIMAWVMAQLRRSGKLGETRLQEDGPPKELPSRADGRPGTSSGGEGSA